MAKTSRRPVVTRLAAPAALVGVVALFGLVTFSSGAARADTTTTTAPVTISTAPGAQPGTVQEAPTAVTAVPSLSAVAAADSPSNQSGIAYVDPLSKSFVAPGEALFQANCSSCHGAQANGKSGIAPNLQGLGAGTVDFWVSTGRMPLANISVQAIRKPSRFDRLQTLEIAAYVQSLTPGQGTQVPIVRTAGADLEQGNTLFTLNCAACHTISGAGDALADGAYAPSLHLADPTQVVEAIRSGPGNMPRFGPGNITNTEARDISAYVTGVLQHPNNSGGAGLGGIGPVGEGFVGLLIGVGLLMLVCFWIGDRAVSDEKTGLDDPHLQPSTKYPGRMQNLAIASMVIGMVGFIAFIWVYWIDATEEWEAAFLALGMLGLGIGTIAWGKYLMPQGPFVEERHEFHSSDDERKAFNAAITGRGGLEVKRRGLLLGVFAVGGGIMTLALLIPGLRSLGPKPAKSEDTEGTTDNSFFTTNWKKGVKLVTVDGREVQDDDLDVGGVLTVFPKGHEGSSPDQVILIRLASGGQLPLAPPGNPEWTVSGQVAYSKLCTHLGCPVGLYQERTQQLVCPCHQSIFDVNAGAIPQFGPAPRPLPQLPITVDATGQMRANGSFDQAVGPGFWERP